MLWPVMEKDLIIELKALSSTPRSYSWEVHKEFFENFENEEILAGDIRVEAVASKAGEEVLIDLALSGTLTVPCDRCGEPVQMHCGSEYKFVALSGNDSIEKDGREVLSLEEGAREVDLGQVVYDYAMLSLPIQCFHEEGECSEESQAFLSEQQESILETHNNPFAALKDIITIKK